MDAEEIIKKIKQKKEFSSLPDSFVLSSLKKYSYNIKQELKKSEQKALVKLVRADLRRHTGMFQRLTGKYWKKRESLLEQNKISDLLKTHASTKERIQFYPELKKVISNLNAKSILDLGCGLNPLALASPGIIYYALDIQQSDLDLIKKFFEKNKIEGKTINQDVSLNISNLPPADLCLMLKLLDILDDKSHKKALSLLEKIKCKNFIISFSTKTLSGKPMLHKKRPWLERIIRNLNYKFCTISSENEIFYIVEKAKNSAAQENSCAG